MVLVTYKYVTDGSVHSFYIFICNVAILKSSINDRVGYKL